MKSGFTLKLAPLLVALSLFGAIPALAFDFEGAGARYGVSPLVLRAISKVESSNNPLAIGANRNGSVDLGHMQVNSVWNGKEGIEWKKLTDSNYCTYVGAYILARELQRYSGNLWDAVAAYHIGKSPADWEEEARKAEGYKKELALWRADRGRWYAGMVYRALVKIQKKEGLPAEPEPQREARELESRNEKARSLKTGVVTGMASYSANPFGSVLPTR